MWYPRLMLLRRHCQTLISLSKWRISRPPYPVASGTSRAGISARVGSIEIKREIISSMTKGENSYILYILFENQGACKERNAFFYY